MHVCLYEQVEILNLIQITRCIHCNNWKPTLYGVIRNAVVCTGPSFPVFSGTVATLAPNANCKPPTTTAHMVPGPALGGAINGSHLTVSMNGALPPAVNGTLSHCDVSNGCNSVTATTCPVLPTPSSYYQAREQAISINNSACTLKPVIPIATCTAPTLGPGTENMSYAASTIRPLHPSFPLTMPWVPPPLPATPISGSYKVIVPSKMDCNCAQCQQLQPPSSTTLSHRAQLSPADPGVQQWSPGEQNSDCTQSSPLAVAPQHSATPSINTAHWNDWQPQPQQQPQLGSCAEEDGQALPEESYYEQSPTASMTLCRYVWCAN